MSQARILFIFVLTLLPGPLLAQGGCVNSPENATLTLVLVGAAAASLCLLRKRGTKGSNL